MKSRICIQSVSLTLMMIFTLAFSGNVRAQDSEGGICPDPMRCGGAADYNLSFKTPNDGIARGEYRSVPFYAIILRTTERCRIAESERLRTQRLFPRNKVFMTRFGCEDDPENTITYTNVNDKFGFLAVYGGSTLEEAQKFLAKVKATRKFPGANLRRMQAVLVYP